MADLTVVYSLATPAGTILFNNGTFGGGSITNLYWISAIHGLDSPTIRAPVDDKPFGDGGLVHKFWKGPRRVGFDGNIIIQSNIVDCRAALNVMESALTAALDSILQADGTLTWTPTGGSGKSLTVRYEVPLDIQPADDYKTRTFTFGLVSAAASPT